MEKYKNLSDFLKNFYIPSYVLSPEAGAVTQLSTPPESPVIVFINSKSGGQLGAELILTYRTLLNEMQVHISIYPYDSCLNNLENDR